MVQRREAKDTFLDFVFYKLDPSWRRLAARARRRGAEEFASTVKRHSDLVKVRSYLTLGLREDADLLLWLISDDVLRIQNLLADLFSTGLGRYLQITHSFLSMARPSQYSPFHPQAFERDLEPLKFLVVYPFAKDREWYLLSYEARKEMMEEHMDVGRRFPTVRLNTTYSFGLDDQDFVLAFETDSLADFQDLVMKLRETKVSRYTVRDTPMIVCVLKSLEDALNSLGR